MRAMLVGLLGAALLTAQQSGESKKVAEKQTTLVGCVDERDETYVLAEDSMKNLTVLKARGFSDDNFARFVGTKARVQGELKVEGERRILYATQIDKVAETCH